MLLSTPATSGRDQRGDEGGAAAGADRAQGEPADPEGGAAIRAIVLSGSRRSMRPPMPRSLAAAVAGASSPPPKQHPGEERDPAAAAKR